MRFSLFHIVLLFVAFASASIAAADSLSQIEASLGLASQSATSQTASVAALPNLHSSNGALFNSDSFDPHPYQNGNPNWEAVWKVEDDAIVKKGFGAYRNECFDMQTLGCCCVDCSNCPWKMVGYWWPEVVISLNDYCISALMGPLGSNVTDPNGMTITNPSSYAAAGIGGAGAPMNFHGACFSDQASWRDGLRELLGPDVASTIIAGLPGRDGGVPQQLPAELQNPPHLGRSAVTSVGIASADGFETSNLEARLFRTWTDVEASRGTFNPVEEFAACFTPRCTTPFLGTDIWPRLHSENNTREMPKRWRFPERSEERVYTGGSCNARYQLAWQGVPEAATFSDVGDYQALRSSTCASYRVSDTAEVHLGWKSPLTELIPDVIPTVTPQLEANCLQPEIGQVYPLVGQFQSDSEAAGSISIALRANEWASWCANDDRLRSNIFNYKGAFLSDVHLSTTGQNTTASNLNRSSGFFWGPRSSSYISWPTPPDKLQRVFPRRGSSDQCFSVNDADKRLRPELFPIGLYDGSTNGETRFVIWNYRTCCVCPECPEGEMLNCIPVSE